jgi:hypothetical protein
MSETNSLLSSIITVQEVNFFRSMIGKDYDKENIDVNEKIKLLYKKLKSAANEAATRIWEGNARCKCKLAVNNQHSQHLRIRDYLPVKIFPENKYSKIVQYWVVLGNGDEYPAIRILLSITDQGKPTALKNLSNDLRNLYQIEKIIKLDNDKSVEELAGLIEQSILGFNLDYKEFCSQLQPKLEETFNEIISKNNKSDSEDEDEDEDEDEESTDKLDAGLRKKNVAINRIFYGPPGTGKTFRLQDMQEKFSDRCKFVTFHQSYGYEEFVEGLRPVLIDSNHSGQNSDGGKDVKYKIEPGIFKELCDRARKDPNNGYAIFIDEINRGNISKIFGELITLIELDKRSDPNKKQEQQFQVSLAYSKESFTVPANVSIFGSMNTADRSLALIDTALRRRFEFKALYPDTREEKDPDDKFSAPLSELMVGEIDVRKMLEAINDRIELLYDRDHCIGHAYFTGLLKKEVELEIEDFEDKRFVDLQNIFFARIKPLLEEYFFENWENIRRVLGDDQKDKSEEKLQFLQKIRTSDGRHLFDEASEPERFRYRWNDAAFKEPEAYIRIYSNLKKQVSL